MAKFIRIDEGTIINIEQITYVEKGYVVDKENWQEGPTLDVYTSDCHMQNFFFHDEADRDNAFNKLIEELNATEL